MRRPALAALALAATPLAAQSPARALDVLDYDLTLELPDAGRSIAMTALLTVRRAAPADTLWLDLRDLRVDEVLVGARRAAFARPEHRIGIPLPRRAGPGADTLRVTVRYGGEVRDGLIANRDARGRWTYFGDNWPNRGSHWIASVDHPSDKATVSWSVGAPSTQTVVANGALVERRPLGVAKDAPTRTLTRWRSSRPIPVYLMVVGVGPLVERPLGEAACGLAEHARCVAQSVYVVPEQAGSLPRAFEAAARIVEYFARLVGPFPYEKLSHVQSATRFGGMENASAIFYPSAAFERGTLDESLIAHETAHQWFGDAVTEREWSHLWLSEGFATYFDQLWTEHSRGPDAARASRDALRQEVLRDRTSVPHRPVIDTVETNLMRLLNANSYQKGGFVLHMLRREVGDSAFFAGLRDYYAAHRHETALTDDLQAAVERRAGRDVRWFFDQWLRRPGHPELEVGWRWDAAQEGGRVVLDVRQSDRFGFWRVPLVVSIEADGRTVVHRLEVPAERAARLVVPTPLSARPARVVLDPDADLLAVLRLDAR
ncbi:MAG TPA: M1 family metallopeptidase [Gemmatimonadaceae bacterium]|nr:M1 family metallopeptidase [Gemmatimonadaceae bacterium]